jgi:hypothetical protein
MRDFGVLEQEVLIGEFASACRAAGFRDVRIKTLAYSIPAFDLTPEQFVEWTRLAESKRPARALRKVVRGVMEFFGLGQKDALFEETFGMSLVRTLRHAMEDHPIILASKQPLDAGDAGARWAAQIAAAADTSAVAGGTFAMRATLTTRGSERWPASTPSGTGQVRLGVQLLDAQGRLINRDHFRVDLPQDLPPGASATVSFACPVPHEHGDFMLKLDMVAEGVTWFEPTGSQTAAVHATIRT